MATTRKTTSNPVTEAKDDTVLIQLPIIEGESDSVYVSVNLKSYQIKRGVQVRIPSVVAEVLETSSKQMMAARERQKELASKSYGEV